MKAVGETYSAFPLKSDYSECHLFLSERLNVDAEQKSEVS